LCAVYALFGSKPWFSGGQVLVCALQVEQSLGLGIMPFFNKHSISLTRFIQVFPKKFLRPGSKATPPVLVLHSRYGAWSQTCFTTLKCLKSMFAAFFACVKGNAGSCNRHFLVLASQPMNN
jgi:hypothetical protein